MRAVRVTRSATAPFYSELVEIRLPVASLLGEFDDAVHGRTMMASIAAAMVARSR